MTVSDMATEIAAELAADLSPLRTSAQLDKLAPALAAAQGLIRHATEDSMNPHFRKKYSSLTACWDSCRAYAQI